MVPFPEMTFFTRKVWTETLNSNSNDIWIVLRQRRVKGAWSWIVVIGECELDLSAGFRSHSLTNDQ